MLDTSRLPSPNGTAPAPDEAAADLRALIQQIDRGQPSPQAAADLRQALMQDDRLWRDASNLTEAARRVALKPLDPAQRESILLRAEVLQVELGHSGGTALERLLIEQVVTCWLHVELAQLVYGGAVLQAGDDRDMKALDRRVAAAQRRYLKALDGLIKLRRDMKRYSTYLTARVQAGFVPIDETEAGDQDEAAGDGPFDGEDELGDTEYDDQDDLRDPDKLAG